MFWSDPLRGFVFQKFMESKVSILTEEFSKSDFLKLVNEFLETEFEPEDRIQIFPEVSGIIPVFRGAISKIHIKEHAIGEGYSWSRSLRDSTICARIERSSSFQLFNPNELIAIFYYAIQSRKRVTTIRSQHVTKTQYDIDGRPTAEFKEKVHSEVPKYDPSLALSTWPTSGSVFYAKLSSGIVAVTANYKKISVHLITDSEPPFKRNSGHIIYVKNRNPSIS